MLQSQLKRLAKDDGVKKVSSVPKKAASLEVDLEKQLQAWRENPSWVDQPPDMKVRIAFFSCSKLVVCHIGNRRQ